MWSTAQSGNILTTKNETFKQFIMIDFTTLREEYFGENDLCNYLK